jgi:hypothetical protein
VVRTLAGAVAAALLAMLWLLGVRGAAPRSAQEAADWAEVRRLLVEATPRLLRRWVGL